MKAHEAVPADYPAAPLRLTVLESTTAQGDRGPPLNKRVRRAPDGRLIKTGYRNAKWFRRDLSPPMGDIADLATFLASIERNPQLCLVTGRPCGPIPLDTPARRLKYPDGDHPATLQDHPSVYHPVDLDGVEIPGADVILDPQGAAEAAAALLGPEFEDVSFAYQFTSSQHPASDRLHLRLHFLTDRPWTGEDRRRWAMALQAQGVPVDPAIYSGCQVIYTAAPTLDGPDWLPRRSGFRELGRDVVALDIPAAPGPAAGAAGTHTPAGMGFNVGFNAHLAAIGDHPGGRGIHGPITRAIAAAVNRHGSGIDREGLKSAIRAAVAQADTRRHTPSYITSQTSDPALDRSLAGAVRKFGPAADERLARQTPAPLPPYLAPDDTAIALTAEAAQARLREVAADLLTTPPPLDAPPPCKVIRAPTGLGKTRATVAATTERPILWFAPTKQQGAEVVAQYGDRARLLLGREAVDPAGDGEQRMCWRQEELKAIKVKGLARYTAQLICLDPNEDNDVNHCPHWGRCGYTRQLIDPAPVTVVSHAYLGLGEAMVLKKTLKAHPPALAVVDENPLPALLRRRHWAADELIAQGGVLGHIAAELVKGRPLPEVLDGMDREAAAAELDAARKDLDPAANLPDVFPGASPGRNLAILERYTPPAAVKLRSAYKAALLAVQGNVNGLWHVPGNGEDRPHRIHTTWRTEPTALDGLPVLALDATADPEIAAALFRRPVEFHHWHVEPRAVEVVQVRDATLYKRKLLDPASGLQVRVAALVAATGAALITHKDVVGHMQESGLLPAGTLTAHFKGLRGLDGMKDAPALVIAGRTEPAAAALEETARALWPDRDLDLGHRDLIQAAAAYHLRDGTTAPATVRAHPDALVNRVLAQERDAELVQAVGRLRAIHGAEGRRVFLLTSVPVPGLTVDALMNLDDLLPDARASRGLIAGAGVLPLAPRALMRLLPGEWPTEAAARQWVKRLKGTNPGKDIFTRKRTLYLARYRVQGQPGQLATALTWHPAPAAIHAALERLHGRPVAMLADPTPPAPAEPAVAVVAPAAPTPPPAADPEPAAAEPEGERDLAAAPPPAHPPAPAPECYSVWHLVLSDGSTCTCRTAALTREEIGEEIRRGFLGHTALAAVPYAQACPDGVAAATWLRPPPPGPGAPPPRLPPELLALEAML